MAASLSDFANKNDYFRQAAASLVQEVDQGLRSAGVNVTGDTMAATERVARGFAAELMFRMNNSAQNTGLPGYLEFLRGAGSNLSQWDDFGTFYDHLHQSLVEEMVNAGTPRRQAPGEASQLMDGLADRTIQETWSESVDTARNLLA